ncbi:MAG: heavy-metal-associated domain-containing protein [Alphaproteobacteria bacterium]|nr:heavy-metal-associated domain-containing protein [Alphaproteobacteria bacterium]
MQKFSVPDMTCGHCKKTIEAAIVGLDSAAKIEADLDQHVLAVTSTIDTEKMIGTLKEAGYPATLI